MKRNVLYWLWIAAIVALVVLHAVHIRADFPNHSPWMDFSKFTDEGWYGKAAVDSYAFGSWFIPGDFNAAVVLPVLPLLERAVFLITGPGLVPARLLVLAFFAANLVLVYFLVRRFAPCWAALLAVTLLAANAFLYAFSRLAILEQLFMFFLLLSWLIALYLPRAHPARIAALVACGFAMCLSILSKTTAAALLPSTFFLLWTQTGSAIHSRLKSIAIAALAAAIPWTLYYYLWVRPNYLADYRYFFIANWYGHPSTLAQAVAITQSTFQAATFVSTALVMLCLALLALSLFLFRKLWWNPLVLASLIATAGYFAFIAWHNNVQPRYYQVVAFLLAIVIALAIAHLAPEPASTASSHPLSIVRNSAVAAVAITLTLSTAANLRQMIHWLRYPEYTWLNAATELTRYVDQHPNGNPLLVSVSGDEITLVTGLPAINDQYGSSSLVDRIKRYHPGWYAVWNAPDPDVEASLESEYRVEQVAVFHAFDFQYRDRLILYKLIPLTPAEKAAHQAESDDSDSDN